MVYSLEILGSNPDDQLRAQSPGPSSSTRVISVLFDGQSLDNIAGPTPFVDLSSSFERNEAGDPIVINNKITINGKITRGLQVDNPNNGSGIRAVMSGISGIQDIFKKGSCGLFQVKCNQQGASSILYSAAPARVVSLDFNKSNDNWVFTADYSIVLEYLEPGQSGQYVKSYSDAWNIEPLEDYVYINDITKTTVKKEYDKSPLIVGAGGSNPQSNGAVNNEDVNVGYANIPRYKVSRTISAIGIPSGTGCGLLYSIDSNKFSPLTASAFSNARQWVQDRSSAIFLKGTNGNNQIWSPVVSGYLYNHLRSVNFDVYAAKYEITDTWLAMPTGIYFVEDYSIELSTDDKYIHTVRVQGEITGLSIVDPTITGINMVSGTGGSPPFKFDLSPSTKLLNETLAPPPLVIDAGAASSITKISANKYANAFSGWLNDVKPYLYRRASMVMNHPADRRKGYVSPTTNPPPPPNNPVYCIHNVLNIIPVSTSESYNPKRGTVSYSYEFNNKFTIISGVLYENVSVQETGPTESIAEVFVLGRALGPILQNLGTKTATRKTVTVEVGVVPPTSVGGFFMQSSQCPVWTGGTVYKTISGIMEGMKPFGDRDSSIFGNFNRSNIQGQVYISEDNHSWDPTNGRYSRTVGWIYQHCNNNKHYLDY